MAGQLFTHIVQRTPVANPETLVQYLAATHQRFKLVSIDFGPLGANAATAPLAFEIVTQTNAGTSSSASTELRKLDLAAVENINSTALKTFTAEPTLGVILHSITLHQQGSRIWYPPAPLVVPGAVRLGIRYVSAVFVEVKLNVTLEE